MKEQQWTHFYWRKYAVLLTKATNEEAGQAIKSACDYFLTGEVRELPLLADLLFSYLKVDIDESAGQYVQTCERNKVNGEKGGRPKNPSEPSGFDSNPSEPEENRTEKKRTEKKREEKEKLSPPPISPSEIETILQPLLDYPEAYNAVCNWIEYKEEKNMPCTKIELKKLVKTIIEYDVHAAVYMIERSIGNGYKGVVFD